MDKERGPWQRRVCFPLGDKCCEQARASGTLNDFLTITIREEGEKRVLVLGEAGQTPLRKPHRPAGSEAGGGKQDREWAGKHPGPSRDSGPEGTAESAGSSARWGQEGARKVPQLHFPLVSFKLPAFETWFHRLLDRRLQASHLLAPCLSFPML